MDLLNPCDQCDRFTSNAPVTSGKDTYRLCSACLDNLAFVNSTPVDDLRVIASQGVRP
jgi:hypothetical protein